MGKLAGINFHGINPMIKVCTGKLLWCLTLKILKECHYTKLIYVTGYWKTDHNVTLGQLHFIGPANSHTHALSMHCCITGLS